MTSLAEAINIPNDHGLGDADDEADELAVLASLVDTLGSLSGGSRQRVLNYLVARFGRGLSASPTPASPSRSALEEGTMTKSDTHTGPLDIRTFKGIKLPANGQEMAALVAYYLAYKAPEDQRRETISPADIDKYFKQAAFPLPTRTRTVLVSAKNSGYLEEAGNRGEYKLSPVGYNLIEHHLPRTGQPATVVPQSPRRRSRRNQAKATSTVSEDSSGTS
jgi:hypothetical protein